MDMDPDEFNEMRQAAEDVVAAHDPSEQRQQAEELKKVAAKALLADSYSRLQLIIGILAFALPVIVALGAWLIDGQALQGSISSYYYTRTGGYFIGSLCVIGVFLFTYQLRPVSKEFHSDKWWTNLAGLAVIGVALFPTSSDGATATGGSRIVALVHVLCAATFFSVLAILSLSYFTRVGDGNTGWINNLKRAFRNDPDAQRGEALDNRWYRACGWTIVGSLVAIVINNKTDAGFLFWLEGVIVWAFSIAWIRKSHCLTTALRWLRSLPRRLADPPQSPQSAVAPAQ